MIICIDTLFNWMNSKVSLCLRIFNSFFIHFERLWINLYVEQLNEMFVPWADIYFVLSIDTQYTQQNWSSESGRRAQQQQQNRKSHF